MRTLKNVLVFLFIILMGIYSGTFFHPSISTLVFITIFFPGLFIFNLVVRKSLSFKSYFCSPYNIFTAKVKADLSFEIPKELLFEKVIEVIQSSKFKLVEEDQEKFEILATSSMTMWSWGENIYISFESIGKETQLKFYSTSFLGIYSWGKNEKNYDDFLNQIENSMII